ncbi:MAG: hypothetical protein UY09_C0012G0041 [Parcubacteria group bacterium GW2011_GWA2_47_8]|nr:MAG: hypothetical protein UY09_C0012G0041 [Parcubacteria group bacterium GW2011_GWA2_47_8]
MKKWMHIFFIIALLSFLMTLSGIIFGHSSCGSPPPSLDVDCLFPLLSSLFSGFSLYSTIISVVLSIVGFRTIKKFPKDTIRTVYYYGVLFTLLSLFIMATLKLL